MNHSAPTKFAKRILRPDPVNGEVVDIDTGYDRTIVVTVEKGGVIYYETYELTDVTEIEEAS